MKYSSNFGYVQDMSTTADPAEIARYNSLAATWWQPDGPMWPLHKLNDLRGPYVVNQICTQLVIERDRPKPLSGLAVLDIGCGAGLLAEALAAQGASVLGVDPAKRNIEIARAHALNQGLDIEYRVGDVGLLKPSEHFDAVLNMEVVEHVAHLPSFIERCCAHTRPGGLHFIATINRSLASWLTAIVGAEHVLGWLPKGTHQWRKFVKPNEAQTLLEQHHHQIVARTGVSINPLTRHYRLTPFLGVNYMLTARRGS